MTQPSPPVRTYESELLTALAPSNKDFSRTWVRTLLRDVPEIDQGGVPVSAGQPNRPRLGTWPEFSRTDAQIEAALSLDAVIDTAPAIPVVYYRPHITAARLYLGDPALWKSRAVDGSSESRRDSREIVGAWLAQGRALDAMIPDTVVLPAFETAATTLEPGRQVSERPGTVVVKIGGGW